MASQENNTQGMVQTQNAVEFINKSVLKPDVTPMKGTAAPLIDQATGMMIQDLQTFLKGFEQVGIVALAKLANNILTYGTYYPPINSTGTKPNVDSSKEKENPEPKQKNKNVGSDVLNEIFAAVGEYAKTKAQVNSLLKNIEKETSEAVKDLSNIDKGISEVVKDLSNIEEELKKKT